jgi:hypothetical protein
VTAGVVVDMSPAKSSTTVHCSTLVVREGVEPLLTAVLLYLGFGFRFLGCTCEGVRDTWVFGERVESQELARWTLESGPGIAEGIVD